MLTNVNIIQTQVKSNPQYQLSENWNAGGRLGGCNYKNIKIFQMKVIYIFYNKKVATLK